MFIMTSQSFERMTQGSGKVGLCGHAHIIKLSEPLERVENGWKVSLIRRNIKSALLKPLIKSIENIHNGNEDGDYLKFEPR